METMERKNKVATMKMGEWEGPREDGRRRQQCSRQQRAQGRSARCHGEEAVSCTWAAGTAGLAAEEGGRLRMMVREQVAEAGCQGAGAEGTDGGHQKHRHPRALQRQ